MYSAATWNNKYCPYMYNCFQNIDNRARYIDIYSIAKTSKCDTVSVTGNVVHVLPNGLLCSNIKDSFICFVPLFYICYHCGENFHSFQNHNYAWLRNTVQRTVTCTHLCIIELVHSSNTGDKPGLIISWQLLNYIAFAYIQYNPAVQWWCLHIVLLNTI